MSTTKLPEAFEPMNDQQGKDRFANGYNACLEATGAKELWEANLKARDAILDLLGSGMVSTDGSLIAALRDAMNACNAALAKSNPSNTVG